MGIADGASDGAPVGSTEGASDGAEVGAVVAKQRVRSSTPLLKPSKQTHTHWRSYCRISGEPESPRLVPATLEPLTSTAIVESVSQSCRPSEQGAIVGMCVGEVDGTSVVGDRVGLLLGC